MLILNLPLIWIMRHSQRVGILTLHRSLNAGAFLQAFSLQETLRDIGVEPEFLTIKNWSVMRRQFRRLFSRKPLKTLFNIRSLYAYKSCLQRLKESPLSIDDNLSMLQCVVVGSDELWNLENPTFETNPAFFGVGVDRPCIAYAPSLNRSKKETIVNDKRNLEEGLLSFKYVSGRDQMTITMLEAIRKAPASRTLDPTFLYPLKAKTTPVSYTHLTLPTICSV